MKIKYSKKDIFRFLGIIIFSVIFSESLKAQTNADNSFFTGGTASVSRLSVTPDINCGVSKVTFQPGTRTIWHAHAGGQVIVVTSGTAWYQEKGKPKQIIAQGEAVLASPGVMHWHGASPDAIMSHTVATPNLDKGGVTMASAVTDREYHGSH